MFTTGTKLLLGSTILAIVAAIAYGISQDDILGTVGLASAAVALAVVTGINVFTRDANVWVDEVASLDTVAAAANPPGNSIWPLLFAGGGVVLTVGLVTHQSVFIAGLVVLLASGAEWTAQAWAERASADAAYNAEVRSRIANPLEFPLGAAAGVALIAFFFSRIMLWLSKSNSVAAFAVVGALILAFAFFFAYKPGLRSRAAVGLIAVGSVSLVAGGVAAALGGQREINEHHTTGSMQAEGEDVCTSPNEFSVDHNASQSVAATASAAAFLTLERSGELTYTVDGGVEPGSPGVTLARSTPSNIVFRNRSGAERRLSVSLGTTTVDAGDGSSEVPYYACTTLIDDGGSQNLTLRIGPPSTAFDEGYFFFVPGVDTASVKLIVP